MDKVDLKGRILIQNCISAKLQLNWDQRNSASEQSAKFVTVENALVVYVCFKSNADETTVSKIVKLVLEAKIWNAHASAECIHDCDVLLIPQATLGAKLKGKQVQYHGNCEKQKGNTLWDLLIEKMKSNQSNVRVAHETYGNRQVLSMETEGPFSRIFDIS